eukprot:CAMPEP_0184499812 /NCGR_PEP_ID=MMETSP0113_2-20130426/42577_1 /TAXON_ID=91329 /ORGANISM="Norrisiella sphaerica, Strain BC52" /LENGTH=74 /DNA_ID=CAMNT_0026887865 /DNA_START=20 /DNA_END=241 /DNA_ORIENTATION=+
MERKLQAREERREAKAHARRTGANLGKARTRTNFKRLYSEAKSTEKTSRDEIGVLLSGLGHRLQRSLRRHTLKA